MTCSFCDRHNRTVHIVAGRDGLTICQVCVAAAAEIIDRDAGVDPPPGGWRGRWPFPDPARSERHQCATDSRLEARRGTGLVPPEPQLDPDDYPPIDPRKPAPDDPGQLLPDTPDALPPAPAEPGPGDPDDPDGVPEPA